MRICITLDDVLRAKTRQFGKIYQKYIDDELDIDNLEITTNDLKKVFNMTKSQYNKFLYEDYPFEIFAEAPVCERMLDKVFNLWHIKLANMDNEEENIEVIFANPKEFGASIGYTYFFLSQISTKVREIYLPKDHSDIWNKCDVLITADPELISEKPEGKTCIKIDMPYNTGCLADYAYEKLSDFLNDETIINKILGKENEEQSN